MKTFCAHLIYRIQCENVASEQYEEQWRIVMAADEEEALKAAKEIAAEEEETFLNRKGKFVKWQLAAVKEVRPFEIKNGALLCSTIKEIETIVAPLWETSLQK